ncbi:MAG: hypothetical protein OHK0029_17320 [Armatimonadaceae bacterium]
MREIARSNDIVWEAVDPQVNRRIALKELLLDPSLTGQAKRHRIERFYREARAAGAMNHPNIVTIHEVGEWHGRYFIAMEFLDGQTLRDRLMVAGALSLQEAVQVTTALCDALQYAHERGVIHRDIKPDNIFILRPDNRVKLADFGIARITTEQQLTVAGQIFGTPSYMSPEQVLGKEIDARSDIFALGIVLYEMVTGRKPFIGDSVVTITYRIMNEPTPALLGTSPTFDSVIQKATAKNPAERFSSAAEFRAALISAAAAERRSGTTLATGVPPSGPDEQIYPMPPQSNGSGFPASGAQATAMYGNVTQQHLGGAISAPSVGHASGGTVGNLPSFSPAATALAEPIPQASPEERRRHLAGVVAAIAFAGAVLFGAGWAFTSAFATFAKGQSKQNAATSSDYERGALLYNSKRYEEAAGMFQKARNDGSINADLKRRATEAESWSYRALGGQAAAIQNYRKAIEWYTLALSLLPNDAEARNGLESARQALAIQETGSANPADAPGAPQQTAPPPALPPTPGNSSSPFGGTNTNQWLQANQQRAGAAQNFLNQGNNLFQQGNMQDACRAWNDARMAGPGTTPAIQAGQLYQQHCQQFSLFGR